MLVTVATALVLAVSITLTLFCLADHWSIVDDSNGCRMLLLGSTVRQNSSFPVRATTALRRRLHWLPIDHRPPYLASLLHNYSPPWTMRSSSAKLLKFRAIIFHSAYMLFALLLPPPETRCHRMSVVVHHLIVFGTTLKHIIFQFCLFHPLTPNPHVPHSNLTWRFINHLLT